MLPELSIRRGTMAEAGWWLPGWFDGAGFHATDAAIPRGDSVLLLQAKEGSQTAYVADLHGSHHSRDWTLAVLTVPGSKPFCTIETSTNLLDWKPYLTACSGSVPVAASETARYFRLP